MQKEFNLLDEPWILVREPGKGIKEVSLKEAFIHAHCYSGLAGETKTQDFVVLRLLVAIMHTVFSRYNSNGESVDLSADPALAADIWEELWYGDMLPRKPFLRYFDECHDCFWLFAERRAFFQSASANKKGAPSSPAKMIGTLFESANKPRLFSGRTTAGRRLSYSEAARWLLHIVNFDDISAKQPTPKRTWTGQLSLIALKGRSLKETLLLNYNAVYDPDRDVFTERPAWERDFDTAPFNNIIPVPDNQAELLTLQSRRVWLCREDGFVTGYYLAAGDYFEDKDVIHEQMTLWKSYKDKKETLYSFRPRAYTPEKKLWQEFENLAVLSYNEVHRQTSESYRSPGVIRWFNHLLIKRIIPRDSFVYVITAAVIYDLNQATSLPVKDLISDSLTFHARLLEQDGSDWRKRIYAEIDKTDEAARAVLLLEKNLEFARHRRDKDGKTELSGERDARASWYDRVDRPFRLWISELDTKEDPDKQTAKLENQLRALALKEGRDLISRTGADSLFGWSGQNDDKVVNTITSSAQAINLYESRINSIFTKGG